MRIIYNAVELPYVIGVFSNNQQEEAFRTATIYEGVSKAVAWARANLKGAATVKLSVKGGKDIFLGNVK